MDVYSIWHDAEPRFDSGLQQFRRGCQLGRREPPRVLVTPASYFHDGAFTSTATGNIDDLDFGTAALIRMDNASLATIRGPKAGSSLIP